MRGPSCDASQVTSTALDGKSTLKGDIFGGITAGIVALPLALAFGVSSGLGAAYGLYGAIFIGFFAAIFGGTAVQISGPTGPMTVVTAAAVIGMAEVMGSNEAALPALVVTFVLAGLIQVGMGFSGVGSLIKFIPYPVVSGFMSGIGVIIILLQLFPAVGLESPKGGTVPVITHIGELFANVNLAALAVTAITVIIIYQFPRITKAVPSALVALLAVSMGTYALDLDVPVIGDIPKGFPAFLFGGFSEIASSLWVDIFKFATALAALGAIDSLLTSVVADNMTKTRHNSNRELIGQGVGNVISGAFGGLPGAGATMRTVVNVNAGGKTRLSGAIHSVLLLAVLLGLGTLAAHIPKPALAGILFTVGYGILDFRGLRHMKKVPRTDAAVMVVVLLVTVFFDLLTAVGLGVVMATFLFMKRMSHVVEDGVELERLSAFKDEENWSDEHIPASLEQSVYVKRITGPLFFGFAQSFQQILQELPDVHYVILRLKRVPFVDQTGAYALEEAIRVLEERGVTVMISGLQEQPADLLRRLAIIPDRISEERTFSNFEETIAWLQDHDAKK